METWSIEIGQTPFVMVQVKIFSPKPILEIAEFGSAALAIVPVPDTKAQEPVPIDGVFPDKVALSKQTVWSFPATAVVGASFRVIVTSAKFVGQLPLLMVQRKTFGPIAKSVTPELFNAVLVIVAPPLTTVQVPVPESGCIAFKLVAVAHTVWSNPAFAILGSGFLVIVT